METLPLTSESASDIWFEQNILPFAYPIERNDCAEAPFGGAPIPLNHPDWHCPNEKDANATKHGRKKINLIY